MDLDDQLKKLQAEDKRLNAEWDAAREKLNEPHGKHHTRHEERTAESKHEVTGSHQTHSATRPLEVIESDIKKNDKEIANVERALQREAFREVVKEFGDRLGDMLDIDWKKGMEQVKWGVSVLNDIATIGANLVQAMTAQPAIDSAIMAGALNPPAQVQQHVQAHEQIPGHQQTPGQHPHTQGHPHTHGEQHPQGHPHTQGHPPAPGHPNTQGHPHTPEHQNTQGHEHVQNREDKEPKKEQDRERDEFEDALRTVGELGLVKKDEEVPKDPKTAKKYEELKEKQRQGLETQIDSLVTAREKFAKKYEGKPDQEAQLEKFDKHALEAQVTKVKQYEEQRRDLLNPHRQHQH